MQVSSSVFSTLVRAFKCSCIDDCNSQLIGLPKVRLSTLRSVLNAIARRTPNTLLSHFLGLHQYLNNHIHVGRLPISGSFKLKFSFWSQITNDVFTKISR